MPHIAVDRLLNKNVNLLKSRTSKAAYEGVLIAVGSTIFATLLVSHFLKGEISLDGIIEAQANNFALWVLDCMPFVFGFWGQYSSSLIAHQASALIIEQTQELRSKAESLERQVNHSATHDVVTDLANSALFYDRLERAVITGSTDERQFSVLLVEIENLKEVYDTLGRNSSDIILKQVAGRLGGFVLDSNNVARLDSNIFSLLEDNVTNAQQAEEIAFKIHKALEPVFVIGNLRLTVHANIGIVLFPEHGDDAESLIQRAGVALYIAGNSNQGIAVYDPSFDKHSPKRLTLMGELRHAIKTNQLDLYYQGKISIANGELCGAEALVRWNHPIRGAIFPDEFVPISERTRMIKPLTTWVLKRAFTDCAQWHKQGHHLLLSINLSAKDLHDPELPDLIAGILAAADIKPEWIIFEITESSIMHDPERALEIIHRLHQMGFKFSIDDYGTGYSSLVYLKQLPLAELKIDRSFVKDILINENDAVIVKATINMAHNLGLQVTAEGVENRKILARLNEYGCDFAQGYYFNPPISIEQFNAWMESVSVSYKS